MKRIICLLIILAMAFSLLVACGVPMKNVQDWLGHSDMATTANIYSHIDAESIEVKIASEAGPCLFRSVDDHSYVVIAMPVQIVEDTYYIEEDN